MAIFILDLVGQYLVLVCCCVVPLKMFRFAISEVVLHTIYLT